MNQGIYGGTFDPPHLGHLIGAESVREAAGLDTVRFIPVALPPHKWRGDLTDGVVRIEMLRKAIGSNEHFVVDDREIQRPGPSYTIETLLQLRQEYPADAFTLIIGLDNLREFHLWKEPERILSLATVVAMRRPGVEVPEVHPMAKGIRVIDIPLIDISSSMVRARVKEGRSIRYLVPAEVEEVIVREGLYK